MHLEDPEDFAESIQREPERVRDIRIRGLLKLIYMQEPVDERLELLEVLAQLPGGEEYLSDVSAMDTHTADDAAVRDRAFELLENLSA